MKKLLAFLTIVVHCQLSFLQLAAQAPTISSFSPASGSVGTLVTITGTNLTTPAAFTIGGVSAVAISNSGTSLVGMVMPGATTGNVSVTTAGGNATGGSNFTVTATSFPNQQQGNKLVGTGNIGLAVQGASLAMSADGNTAIVGGYADNSDQGAAWVFTRTGSTWTQQGNKLVGTGNIGAARQGISVAISADGNTAIVGGNQDNSNQGATWVFTRSGSTWTQQGSKLVGTGNTGAASQGTSVALSADGNTAVVGGISDNGNIGAIWVFTRSGSTWSQQGNKLVGTGNAGGGRQGTSVAISADGNTAITGAWGDNTNQGATWIFTRSGSTWSQQGSKLVGTGNVGQAQQGFWVALSANGNTAIIGGWTDNSSQGAAWVFTRSGTTWSQQGSKLVGTGNVGAAQQGIRVAVSADGNTAIIGGRLDNSNVGASWVFTRSGITWSQQGSKLVGTGNVGAPLQSTVAISADGTTALVGGGSDNGGAGATWVFTTTPPPAISSFSPASGSVGSLVTITGANLGNPTAFTIGGATAIVVSNTGTQLVGLVMPGATTGTVSVTTAGGSATGSGNFTVTNTPYPSQQQGNKLVGTSFTGTARQGISVAISSDGNTAVVGGSLDNTNQGAVWIYTRSGSTWSQQGNKLVGTGNIGAAGLGYSVAIAADGNTVIAGGNRDNSNQGAAWVFTRTGTTWSQQGSKLVGTGNTGAAQQGWSVAISANGNTAIVGGLLDNTGQGATWVFTRTGSTWSQQGNKLVGTGNTGAARQGYSVAIAADGNTVIVGGQFDNTGQGAAWIFTRTGSTWSQQGSKLVGTGNTGPARQGFSVAIAANGNTAIIGGNDDNSDIGAVWVFTRSGSTWSQQGSKLVGSGNTGASKQGNAVAISADGNTFVSTGHQDNSGQGATWVFTRTGSNWSQQGNKLTGSGNDGAAEQGWSVALAADGSTAIVGGLNDNSGQGAAWVFVVNQPPGITGAATTAAFTTSYGTVSAVQSFAVAGTNLTANLVATASAGFQVSSDGTTYGSTATFTQSGGTASGTLRIRLAATATVAGTYNAQNIVLSSTGATSVNITTPATGNAVTPFALTITGISANDKTFDGNSTATLSGTPLYVGLQNSETFAVTGTAVATFNTAAIGNNKPVTITGYTAPNGNYTITQPTGLTANITGLAQSTADYRSKANGNFSSFGSSGVWEYNQGGASWVDATQAPVSTNNISITHNLSLDQDYTVGLGKSFTIGSGGTLVVNATRTLSVAGAADFGGRSVTFVSNNSGTAALGQVTGTVTGATNVTVERYIPNNSFRSWRLLSVPTFGGQTIRQAWQEGDANPLPQQNNIANYGTQITGAFTSQAAAVAAGFDSTSVNAGILSWSGTAWANVTTTNQSLVNATKSWFVYIRGERSKGVSGSASNTSATTLRTKGTIYTGDQVNNVGVNAFALIPNLYPSAINFTGLTRTGGVNNQFYIWDSKKLNGSSLGMYQTFSATNSFNCLIAGGSYTLGQPNTTIESGQSFFVTSGAAGSLTLRESAKISGTNGNAGLRPIARPKIDTRLYNGLDEMADANTVVFDAAYSKAVAAEDAPKMGNPGANFAIEKNSKLLAIEGTQPVKENDIIQFRMWNLSKGSYTLELVPANMNAAGLIATLEDTYLKTATVLSMGATTTIKFMLDENAASAAANRFRIVFSEEKSPADVTQSYTIAPNPVENGIVNLQFKNQQAGRYHISVLTSNGQRIVTNSITHAGGSSNHAINLPHTMGSGTYQVEIVTPAKTKTVQSLFVHKN